MTLEITRVDWHGARVAAQVERRARGAELKAAELVLARANQRVPRRTGRLAASGQASETDDGAVVSYGTEYATILHHHPEWHYAEGSGHWLDEAIADSAGDVGDVFASEIHQEIGGSGT